MFIVVASVRNGCCETELGEEGSEVGEQYSQNNIYFGMIGQLLYF